MKTKQELLIEFLQKEIFMVRQENRSLKEELDYLKKELGGGRTQCLEQAARSFRKPVKL